MIKDTGPSVKNKARSLELVAHACNPSYSEGRDQEDHGSKPAPGKQFRRPYLKKPHHIKGLAEWLMRTSKLETLSSNPTASKL
jgi:hypothetical protein